MPRINACLALAKWSVLIKINSRCIVISSRAVFDEALRCHYVQQFKTSTDKTNGDVRLDEADWTESNATNLIEQSSNLQYEFKRSGDHVSLA